MNPHAHPTFPTEADRLHAAGAVYHHDYAGEIDKEDEILADELGITPKQARGVMEYRDKALREHQALILGRVIGLLLETANVPVMTHALAFAAGLDQLNGARSQSQVARELGEKGEALAVTQKGRGRAKSSLRRARARCRGGGSGEGGTCE